MNLTPLSKELRRDIGRRFEPGELVDFLGLSVGDIIECFEEEILEQQDRLEEELFGSDK